VEISIGIDLELRRRSIRDNPPANRFGGIAARRELVKDALEKGNARSRRAISKLGRASGAAFRVNGI
jgi:hypothetical protein